MGVIGILGGTFDPPHVGHLALAHAAYEQLGLDEVLFMPAGDPWQKADRDVTPAAHRMAMVSLAASVAPYLGADDREIDRTGPTYTIETVTSIGDECVLIVGADAAKGVPSWHRADDLLDIASFAVVDRPGVARSEIDPAVLRRCTWVDMPPIDISSTAIRAHVAAGHTPRFLVPDSIASYIAMNGLYQPGTA